MPKTETMDTAAKKAGFNDKGEAHPGVDPKTGERVTVTLDGLKKEFGPSKGEEIYRQFARAGGVGDMFGDLAIYAPDIQIKGAPDSVQIKFDEILAAAKE